MKPQFHSEQILRANHGAAKLSSTSPVSALVNDLAGGKWRYIPDNRPAAVLATANPPSF